ncbi:MAG: MBL fold metallo-hydrolase [Nanoarchaeota archaeon]|nr:MBL fold metallo-hydrolase [Nanoarchaeota archaeon]
MKLTILGSAGNVPIPRLFCNCDICKKAKNEKEPYKRCLASLYINEIKTVIDCPEDIAESLNRRGIKDVDNLFITHWHPDHTFGFRLLIQAFYDFIFDKPNKQINVYIPKSVYATLKNKYPAIQYFLEEKKMGKLKLIEDGEKIDFGNITITAIGFQGKGSDNYAYLIEENGKKALYAPCDTIDFKREIKDLDLLINEQGYFSLEITWEIPFKDLLKRLKEWKPKLTVLTHISEDEIRRYGWKHFEEMVKGKNIKYAYDGLVLEI